MDKSLNVPPTPRNLKIVLATLPASGHVNPMIAIARAVQAAGHDLTFITGEPYRAQLESLNIPVKTLDYPEEIYREVLEKFSKPIPRFPRVLWDRPQSGFFALLPELAAQLIGHLEDIQPDVVLTDYNFYAGPIAAEALGLPYATFCAIVNALPSQDTPTFGAQMAWRPPWHPERLLWPWTRWGSRWYLSLDDRVANRVRRSYGLDPVDFPIWYSSPYLFIAPTTEAFEYPRSDLLPQAVYVGPVTTPARGKTEEFPWDWLEDGRPTLYVSLGTIVKLAHVFKIVIDLARGAKWKAVLSVGQGADLTQFGELPENILLRNYVPQYELLRHVDAVISHGGNNTVTETLLNGKPLIVIPITGDQPESAGRVVKAEAGLRLDIHRLTPEKLRDAINALLDDPRYRAGAERVGMDYQKTDGSATITRLLERLAEARVPLHRPAGMPPTLYTPESADNLAMLS
jgi:zeaxanthin glucosyltransferase